MGEGAFKARSLCKSRLFLLLALADRVQVFGDGDGEGEGSSICLDLIHGISLSFYFTPPLSPNLLVSEPPGKVQCLRGELERIGGNHIKKWCGRDCLSHVEE